MKIVSYNINGVRAATRQGLAGYILGEGADVYCFQEVRASEAQARDALGIGGAQVTMFAEPEGGIGEWTFTFNCGEVAGYAGTLTMTRRPPDDVIFGMPGFWEDREGRVTTVILGDLAIVNAYIPNGNSRLDFKMEFLAAFEQFLSSLVKKYHVVAVGDFNIAHERIDLTNPDECKNKSVFLPIEREAFSRLLKVGLVDAFRHLHPEAREYTWRSYRSVSGYEYKNSSWKYRIDYALVSADLGGRLLGCEIVEQKYSDHIPVILTLGD